MVRCITTVILLGACTRPSDSGRRVIVLGFDGMDWALTSQLMAEGKLPALAALARDHHAQSLETSNPPQSPVAWSDFITGLDAGGHGIFDFIHRDSITMTPYLSTSVTTGPDRTVRIGRWQLPLGGGQVSLLRHGTPFWEELTAAGVPTTIVRMPANFPPTGTADRELSGMGTPDLLGGYGTFTFYTTDPERVPADVSGGRIVRAEFDGQTFTGTLAGPPNPFRTDGDSLRVPIVVTRDATRPVARVVVDDAVVVLGEKEWSAWLPIQFKALPVVGRIRGMVRISLQQIRPQATSIVLIPDVGAAGFHGKTDINMA